MGLTAARFFDVLQRSVADLAACGPFNPDAASGLTRDNCEYCLTHDVRYHAGHDSNVCLTCEQAKLESLRAYLVDPAPFYLDHPKELP